MTFIVIEENDPNVFAEKINERLMLGAKIINAGLNRLPSALNKYWAYIVVDENNKIGEYPYPPTRTLE